MAQRTAAQKAKAAKAAKAKRAAAMKAGKARAAKPQLTQAQKDAREAKRAKEYEANKAAMGKTRLTRRAARDAVHVAALKRFWTLVKNGKPFRYGNIGVKIGEKADVAKLAGAELSAGDWRNVGLRCLRHYLPQGAVESIPGTRPEQFQAVSGATPDQKPQQRVRKGGGSTAKKRAAPSATDAKAKATKAKEARDAARTRKASG